jgi:hypothetical protein
MIAQRAGWGLRFPTLATKAKTSLGWGTRGLWEAGERQRQSQVAVCATREHENSGVREEQLQSQMAIDRHPES